MDLWFLQVDATQTLFFTYIAFRAGPVTLAIASVFEVIYGNTITRVVTGIWVTGVVLRYCWQCLVNFRIRYQNKICIFFVIFFSGSIKFYLVVLSVYYSIRLCTLVDIGNHIVGRIEYTNHRFLKMTNKKLHGFPLQS